MISSVQLTAGRPANEIARQAAVERSGVLRMRGNSELQRIVDNAAARYKAMIAAITIIDRDRQWFAARVGVEADETTRDVSFCAHAIHRPGEPLVVPNATRDLRFSSNPMVRFTPHVRFYAGMPIVDRAGYPLGALCVVDSKPREGTDVLDLMLLAREAERVIAR
jgi:GAF domain-containing protein